MRDRKERSEVKGAMQRETEHRKQFVVSGVCCATEEHVLRKRLDATIGSQRYTFSLLSSELRVDPDIPDAQVIRDLRGAGFSGRLKQELRSPESFLERHGQALWTVAAGILTAIGMAAEWLGIPPLIGRALLLAAILGGGWQVLIKAAAAVRTKTLDMNVLMALAVIGALFIDRWSEGAVVLVLFSVALMLESYSTFRTRRAIESLLAITPQEANILRGSAEHTIPAADIAPGDILRIRPGERIPIDGIIVEGESAVDQAAITGESIPVEKKRGETVYAGSLNGRGSLTVEAVKSYEETTLAQIIHLVEEAEHKRAPVQSQVDRFAAVYTPAVLAVAVVVAVVPPLLFSLPFEDWLYRALVLLVIACPCALVISTPVTLVSALTNAARHGILIKGGKQLEALESVHAIAFDKTGTLTDGRMKVTDVIALDHRSADEILVLAAALESRSEHHLAAAMVEESERRGLAHETVVVEAFASHPGRGVAATIGGVRYYLGNLELCREQQFSSPEIQHRFEELTGAGKTAVVLGASDGALGIIALRDQLRTHSREVVQALRRQGMRHVVMLSGDNERVARAMAVDAGIEGWKAGLLPDKKVEAVQQLKKQYGGVAMVGDGVNDAPALAAATVGIAMGGAGSDTALETADIVLMGDNLDKIPHLVGVSRLAMRIIRQNIMIALGLKLLFLVLSIAGFATLWMAILADDGASLVVIANGLRVLGFRNGKY